MHTTRIVMSSNLDKNLENIRRIDQFASKVIGYSTHAALFNFSNDQNKFLKTEVDGPLFIYERLDQPLYSLVVVNRNSPQNFVEPITDGLQLRYEPPYIFVHREDGYIRSLWVFGEDECKRVFDTLTNLSMELKMISAGATTSSPKNSINNNNDSGAVAAFAAATPPTKIDAAAKPSTPPPSQQQQAIRVSSITATIRGSHIKSNKAHHVGGMTTTLVNCWDASACHCDLEITDGQCLTVLYREGAAGYRSVFAKHPIFLNKKHGIFYFEILIKSLHERLLMGFTAKKKGIICERDAVFMLSSRGTQRRNEIVSRHENSAFYVDDFVCCGINLATNQFLCTKNGAILGY